ncbi:MAG: glutathione S-transferase N-terminal domain-containing protein [Hahellaceae bacterium]|jgi:glutathione S-transferase|nr:glutathione S-transferase N-terminal domain-containing protein [Hahellaceae bacterium]
MVSSHDINILGSVLSSSIRLWRGTLGRKKSDQPAQLPMLFDRENDSACRLVREAFTELNLDAMIYPVPDGGNRHLARLEALSGAKTVPFLFDPNTGQKCQGAAAILDYVFAQYGKGPVPTLLRPGVLNRTLSLLAGHIRGHKGELAAKGQSADKPLTLYSFESSPYSRPVRERLCELELAYHLVNLSKQQIADLGPATQRLHLGEYRPLPDSKRARFLAQQGRVQVPFLVDPNTGQSLFESKIILDYLTRTYAT